jgi:methionyl aminopeptidase
MISIKSSEDIETLAQAGKLLGEILDTLVQETVVGMTGSKLDAHAQEMMKKKGAIPVFLGYGNPPYPASICVSVNEQVVHGIPNDTPFQEGDVVTIDAGLSLNGLIVDSARTVGVGVLDPEHARLIDVTKRALAAGIAQAIPGNHVGDISHAVQLLVEGEGFEVVRALVGHGVGYALHEDPQVPNFGTAGKGPLLKEGMVIAIEPMVTIGSPDVETAEDGWSIIAVSGQPAAQQEHTVAITGQGPRILT